MRLHPASTSHHPPALELAAGFAAIYFVWGSTFLAIRVAVEGMPPFLMAGTRFLSAGAFLYVWRRWGHGEKPEPRHWPGAALVGTLLFMGCNGAVTWSEQRVPSGLTALMLATIPLWMVLLDAMSRPRGSSPGVASPLNARVMTGVVLGIAGLAILLGPGKLLGSRELEPMGAVVLLGGSICWATGSLISRWIPQARPSALAAGMQMLTGGAVLLLASTATGELSRVTSAALGVRAILALLYLIVFGSVIGFTAYTWLLSVTSPARVSTYAFVNPVIAVLLGWVLAGEPLSARTLLASAVIVVAVAMIISFRPAPSPG